MNIFKHIQRKRIDGAKRKAVYTFIFGDYDDLKPPAIITPGWDYICFTDDPTLRSDVWDVRLSTRRRADRQLEHKKYAIKHMILFHQYLDGYDLSLSVGAQLGLNCNLDDLMREHFRAGDDIMICQHPERDCVYDEAEVCKGWLLDDPARIDAQMQRYRAMGYPAHNGLYATGIIGRRHDRANVRAMCEFWWEEYRRGSRRDQLSLNYAIWKSAPIRISAIDFVQQINVERNFTLYPHKSRTRFDGTRIKFKTGDMNQGGDGERLISPGADYIGYIDRADSYGIRGWAADRNRLNTSISVSLYDGDTLITTLLANQPRKDVGAYLGDDGAHGFTIPIPTCLKNEAAHSISIRFETSNINLTV
jgi:Protein of unknown function (DUF616)